MSDGTKIPFCQPYNTGNELNYVAHSIESGWWTTGPMTQEFEKKFAKYTGAKYCIALSSCTAALQLSLEYLKTKGEIKRVGVPSLTFAATANEIVHAGARPIWGDVSTDMCLMPMRDVDAVIPVHLTGNRAFTKYDVPVIEDSAHLIERDQCKNNDNLVCFSFYATKNLAMGEGGAICTNDEEAYKWLKQARHHGISKGGWNRYKEGGSWMYDIDFVGWKANPSDISSGIGLAQLEHMDDINELRASIVREYNDTTNYQHSGLHLYPVLVSERDRFIKQMGDAGIQCSVHFLPLHLMTAYKEVPIENDLSRTEYFGDHLVSLPLFPSLTNEQIQRVCETAKRTSLLLDWDSSLEGISQQ